MQKRTVALAFLAVVLALVAATFLVLRTRWAGDRICALVAARAAAGLPIAFRSCRVEPLALEVEVDGLVLGPPGAPVLAADRVVARLAPVQALGGKVRLARLRLEGPRLAAVIPAGGKGAPAACPPPALARVEVRELEVAGGALDLTFPNRVRLSLQRLDVRARPARRTLRALAGPARAHLEIEAAGVRLEGIDDRPFTAPLARVAADLAPDLSAAEIGAAEAVVDGVRLGARGTLRNLCAPVLDLDATGTGPAREVLAITRIHGDAPAVGTVTAQGRVSGPASRPSISAAVRIEGGRVGWFHPGDLRGELRLTPDLDGLVVDRAEWPRPGGTVVVRGKVGFSRTVPMEWEYDTGGADLADLLDAVGVEGSWVSVRLEAKGRVAGAIVPALRLDGNATGDFREFRTWTRSWRTVKPGTVPVLEARAGHLDVPVRVTADGIRTEGARLTGGRGTAVVDAVAHFSEANGFQVRARGDLDLDVLGHVAGVRVGGLAAFESTVAAAPYGNPHAAGHARAEGLRFLDLALGTGAADFDYGPDYDLRVRDAEGTFRSLRWRGDGTVDLRPSTPVVRALRFGARGRVRDLFDAVQDWVPRTRPYRDVFDSEVEVSGTGAGPADALGGTFEARMASGTFYGRPFDSARMSGTYEDGETARYDRVELRRGAGVARMTGRATFAAPYPWELDLSFAGLALRDAGLPWGEWAGTASGTATLRGSFERPDVHAALNGDGVAVRGVNVGSVQAAATVKGKALVVTGGAEGARFEAEASLDGRRPFRARADVALEDVANLLPGGAPGIRARVRGEATAEGELEDLQGARARVRLDEVQAGHAEFRVQAAAPVIVPARRGRVEVQKAPFVGPTTELTVAGARAASGQLDVSAEGTVDLRLLAGTVPDLKRPHGQLGLEAHVTGTLEAPVLVGAGRLDDAGFQLKTTSVLFSDVRGALAFSQNRVLFEELQATVNGGRARLRGELELASFAPVRLRVEAQLDEVPIAVPAYLPVTLSGRVEAAGEPDATTITGRLHVVRARYTADVALERSMLELRRRAAPPPKPYDKANEWLRFDLQIVVDGDARVENDLVSGPVRGELTVTGTLAAPGVLGTLSMAEGSRARFRGNEFILSHAVLELTDRNKVEASLDVHGEARVRDYQVYLHAFGRLADPQVTLTSTPPLPQPDIVTLLSLGYTRRDAGTGAGVQGVATAAAAQALFSASGLDEQVKRLLPRNNPMVRDLSVRITSEWSELTGQVEPRAEFESFLARDRLRLRYQAPLSGARGQKMQAELRLGKHTSVQYQWDNYNPDVEAGDHGVDLKLRWEWTDDSR